MLFTITSTVDFLGMAVSLWLALYLLGRGFPSRITARAAIVLLALSAFFLGAYINLFHQVVGTAAVRAILLTIGLAVWNDLTHKLLPAPVQIRHLWRVRAIYVFGSITTLLLLWARTAFVGEESNILWVARMGIQPPYVVYGIFQLTATASILYNLVVLTKVGAGPQNRYFLGASLLAISTVVYGVLALALTPPMPRLIQDVLILSSICVLGVSVARYQTLVERRATLQDFPLSLLAVFGLSAVYLFLAWQTGMSPIGMIWLTALAILTHSSYHLVREFLDRLRSKDESALRQQLRSLESNINQNIPFQECLQDGLQLLCQVLESTGAFIAVRDETQYTVFASHHSLPLGTNVPPPAGECSDICQSPPEMLEYAACLVPVIQYGELVALMGMGPLRSRLQYTEDDLDLLIEAADQMGNIIYLNDRKPVTRKHPGYTVSDDQSAEAKLQARSEELRTTLITNPDPRFVKLVEDGLRNLTDFISLGQSVLPEQLGITGETHIEKGKAVQHQLVQAVEALRPAQDCPRNPIPREWYSYVLLHDAYWEGISNNEIMARLYISEGTFHRTRRAAVRSVARILLEKSRAA